MAITNEGFESGWGIWNDGGIDAFLLADSKIFGSHLIKLRDNSGIGSSVYTDVLDLSSNTSVELSFYFAAVSFDNNREDFFFEFSNDGGSSDLLSSRSTDNEIEEIAAFHSEEQGIEISVYPNPATQYVNVDLGDTTEDSDVNIEIFNTQGQRLRLTTVEATQASKVVKIKVNDLESGTYLLRVSNKEGYTSEMKKVVILK